MLSAHREAGKSTSEYAVAAGGSLRAQPARATAKRAATTYVYVCMRGMLQPPMPGAPGGAGAGWRVASAAEQALAAPGTEKKRPTQSLSRGAAQLLPLHRPWSLWLPFSWANPVNAAESSASIAQSGATCSEDAPRGPWRGASTAHPKPNPELTATSPPFSPGGERAPPPPPPPRRAALGPMPYGKTQLPRARVVWTWRWTTGSALSDLGTNPRHDTLVAEGASPIIAW